MKHFLLLLVLASPASAKFYAAAGKVDVSPDPGRHKVWLGGHGAHGREMKGIHDPIYARALVVSDGKRTVGIVSVDVLGLFHSEVLKIRELVGWSPDDYLMVAATHVHSGPDTLGLWGPRIGSSGVDAEYQAQMRAKIADLVKGLAASVREARMVPASAAVNPNGLCNDGRSPKVLDPDLVAARFTEPGGRPIATLVKWSCHPEAAGRFNHQLTADYPGPLCRELEKDGSTCVFVSGAIGGLLKPEVEASAENVEGRFKDIERIGVALAGHVTKALKGAAAVSPTVLEFSTVTIRVPIENNRYLLFLPSLTFGHTLYDHLGRELTSWGIQLLRLRHVISPLKLDYPLIESEVSRIRIGPLEILGIPGEIFPELVLGGFDGEFSFGRPVVSPKNVNPPDLSQAPRGPFLKQHMKGPHKMVIGLANDELGYLVPAYDFKYTATRSMLPQPAGDHYEETNSVGRSATSIVLKAARQLLGVEK